MQVEGIFGVDCALSRAERMVSRAPSTTPLRGEAYADAVDPARDVPAVRERDTPGSGRILLGFGI